jgi:hypothetical protein
MDFCKEIGKNTLSVLSSGNKNNFVEINLEKDG